MKRQYSFMWWFSNRKDNGRSLYCIEI